MQVIICGAGRVGQGIAKRLASEGHDIVIVDENAALVDKLSTDLDVRGIVGNGSHPDVLDDADAENCELMIAVTQFDEVNMVICQVAKSLFRVQQTVARIRSKVFRQDRWADLFSTKALPVDLSFSPEALVGDAIIERFYTQGAMMSAKFAGGQVQLIGLDMDEDGPLLGTNLDQIRGLFPDLDARVIGISKSGHIRAPRSNDTLQEGDRAYIAVLESHRSRLNSIFGQEERPSRLVTIIGAGNVGLYVAEALSKTGAARVRLIENNEIRAKRAVQALRKAVIIQGDGLDLEVLEEAGGARTDFLIAITDDDRTNMLACGLAKQLGVKRTMALVNEPYMTSLRKSLDIDAIVDPRALTVSEILKLVRRGRIIALRSLGDGQAEIVEGITLETSPLIGRKLGYDDMPDGIAAVVLKRGDDVVFPSSKETVKVGDHLTLLFEEERVGDVERYFRVTADYF